MNSQQNRRHGTVSGFTATELLVALATVAVLASLVFAASTKALRTRNKMRDLTNLRTIGQVFHAYLADNNQIIPVCVSPSPARTFAQYLGYIDDVRDWGADVFRNGADEASIRKLFISGYDQRPNPSPADSYASNEYIGFNPKAATPSEVTVVRYGEIARPSGKIYYVPTHFRREYAARFSGAPSNSPFIDGNNTEYKGPFPALFVDGHVEMVEADPARTGRTGAQLRKAMIYPKEP
ncbi:MAG TPA: type II secretion system protein [Chthoniobacteraceae bacterium]|nr:type II secretion system protein [Chthoniobacteraceae bacterium]